MWQRDLQDVLQERLLGHLGIPADRWGWTPGKVLYEARDWYPDFPGYGEYVDGPWEIGGVVVRGGPGWVVMSPLDLARFGLIVATGGVWEGKSPACVDLLAGLLDRDPGARLTAADALEHPWFREQLGGSLSSSSAAAAGSSSAAAALATESNIVPLAGSHHHDGHYRPAAACASPSVSMRPHAFSSPPVAPACACAWRFRRWLWRNFSVTRARMCCYSSTISSVSPCPARKYRRCSDVCHPQ